jgi:hypothetical protein
MAARTQNGYSVAHTATGDYTVGKMILNTIIWHGYLSNTATLKVTDGNSVEILPALTSTGHAGDADAGGTGPIVLEIKRPVNGLITTLTGGANAGTVIYLLG